MTEQASSTSQKGSSVLRKGSQSKMVLKEKIVQIYEAFFRVSLSIFSDISITIIVLLIREKRLTNCYQ